MTNPALQVGDVDQDGYPDLVYGTNRYYEAAAIALGGANPDWSKTLSITAPTDSVGSWLDVNESALLIGGGGMRYGVAWSLPLPVTEDTALHVSSATVWGGDEELWLYGAQFGDLDTDGEDEVFGRSESGSWWVE